MRTLIVAGLVAMIGSWAAAQSGRTQPPTVEVYKSPTCGCCAKWMMHLQEAGFIVKATDVPEVSDIKTKYKVPVDLASCHTALVAGYVVEGHVPAADLWRLVKERPKIAGIAVPGMPEGSPGMEGPKPQPYDVIAWGDGRSFVFATHRP
jgi:hypothetical protein